MKKILVLLILLFPAFLYAAGPIGAPPATSDLPVDTTNFDGSLSSSEDTLQEALDALDDATGVVYDTIANLPAAPSAGDEAGVTDASTSGTCSIAGGLNWNKCVYDGAAWVVIGDGTGDPGSGSLTTIEVGDNGGVGDQDIIRLDFLSGFQCQEAPDTEVNCSVNTVPDSGSATIEIGTSTGSGKAGSVEVKYDSTDFQESTNGLYLGDSPTIPVSVLIGADDTTVGTATLYGGGAGADGGVLNLYLGADDDASISHIIMQVVEDDLTIGPDTNPDVLKMSAGSGLEITSGDFLVAGTGTFTGQLIMSSTFTDGVLTGDGTGGITGLTNLNSVTATELAELETIGATTISAAQWTGLGGATTAGIALWDDVNNVAQLVTLGLTATASEINTPLDGASVTLAEFQQLEAIGATTVSAAQWAALGGATTAGLALWDDVDNVAQLVTLGLSATASEINTPLDGASVTLTEFQELETIGATTISANQWALLGGVAETLGAAELNLLDGETDLASQAELNAVAELVDTADEIIAIINISPTTQIVHEAGGLEADVNGYSGLVAISGGSTTEVDAKSELETQIADVADFAEADGDIYTGTHDFGGADDFEIPNGASPTTDTTGQIALNTDGTDADYTGPVIQISTNGATVGYIPTMTDMPAAGEDNYIMKYDADSNLFVWEADVSAGTTAWDDISVPDNNGTTTIDFDHAAEATVFTTIYDTAGSFFTINNSDDDIANQVYLLELDYSVDDDQALADYILLQDAGGTVLTIQEGGMLSIGANPGDGGIFNLENAAVISWEDETETTLTHVDNTGLAVNLNLEAATLTEGGNAVYNSSETPGGELAGTWATPTLDETGIALTSITIGSILAVDSINPTAAIDLDIGSASLTDVTVVTDGGTAVIDGSYQFPDADGVPSVVGELQYDNTITGLDDGGLVWYDDDEVQTIVAMDSSEVLASGDDGKAVTFNWNSGNGYFELTSSGTGDIVTVGDCTGVNAGVCLDGADTNAGNYIRLWDGDSHYLQLDVTDLSANATISFGDDTNNLYINNGTAILDIAAAATLNIDKGLTVGTNAGTLNFSAAAKTLTVADDATVNQDVQTTDSPTFVGLTLTGAIATPTDITMSGNLSIGATPANAGTGIRMTNNTVLEFRNGGDDGDLTALQVDAADVILIGDANASAVTIVPATTISGALTLSSTLTDSVATLNSGAWSGITTLAMGGALSGVTSLAMGGALSGVTTLGVSDAISLSDGATIDQSANNLVEVTENSDYLRFNFGGTDVALQWSDGTFNVATTETNVDGIMYLDGNGTGKGDLRVRAADDTDYVSIYHDDTDGWISASSGDIIIAPDGDVDDYVHISTATNVTSISVVGSTGTLGTPAAEWDALYLNDGGIIYGENSGLNTLTSSATGWTVALDLDVVGTLTIGALDVSGVADPVWTWNDSDAAGADDADEEAAKIFANMTTTTEDAEVSDLWFTNMQAGARTTVMLFDGSANSVEVENIINAEAGITVSNGTTTAGFVDYYEDEDDGASRVRLIAPALAASYTLTLPTSAGADTNILAVNDSGETYWTSAGAATAWHNIVTPAGDQTLNHTTYETVWNYTGDADFFTINYNAAMGSTDAVLELHNTVDSTAGSLLELQTLEADDDVSHIRISQGATGNTEWTKIVDAGTVSRTLISDGFGRWEFTTTEDGVGQTDEIGIFEIIVDSATVGLEAGQYVFNIVDTATDLFTVDAEGDVLMTGALSGATTITASTAHIGPLLDAAGDEDMDYGSADVDDHTFITDGTGDAEFVVPNDSIGNAELDWGSMTDLTTDGALGADVVDEAHIADNGIDSEHYNDGSIDIEHMSTDSVDYDNTTGSVKSLTPVADTAANFAANFTGANLYGGTFVCNGAGTLQLPAVAVGMNFTIVTLGALAVSADTNTNDLMILDGTALHDGDKATNLSTAGDIIVFQYYDATGWLATSNGWTDGGA
jgi:hypothetical protein